MTETHDPHDESGRLTHAIMSGTTQVSRHSDMNTPATQERAQPNNAASASISDDRPRKSNDESLHAVREEFWGAIVLPDWSNEQATRRPDKPKNWCKSCQCEHPWPKDGYTFHVRSRRANAYLRSLQLAGDIPNIDPLSAEPLAEVSLYRISKDAHDMISELLTRLDEGAYSDDLGKVFRLHLLLDVFQAHAGYQSFQAPRNAQEFLRSAEGADPVTKWNEFF